MAYKDSSVDYGFGQMGSVFLKDVATITSNGKTGMEEAVFCAITFLEDTQFASTGGLIAEDNTMYINSDAGQTGITDNSDVTNGEIFPKGVTIYGRFTQISLASGKVIAYIGY